MIWKMKWGHLPLMIIILMLLLIIIMSSSSLFCQTAMFFFVFVLFNGTFTQVNSFIYRLNTYNDIVHYDENGSCLLIFCAWKTSFLVIGKSEALLFFHHFYARFLDYYWSICGWHKRFTIFSSHLVTLFFCNSFF